MFTHETQYKQKLSKINATLLQQPAKKRHSFELLCKGPRSLPEINLYVSPVHEWHLCHNSPCSKEPLPPRHPLLTKNFLSESGKAYPMSPVVHLKTGAEGTWNWGWFLSKRLDHVQKRAWNTARETTNAVHTTCCYLVVQTFLH